MYAIRSYYVNIQDINELLCEIAQRLNLISLDAIEALWRRASQGNKWVFCKVIIESDASRITSYNVCYTKLLRGKGPA